MYTVSIEREDTMIYKTTLHFKERADSLPNDRLFDAWLSGASNFMPTYLMRFALSSSGAIEFKASTEKLVYQWNQAKKFDGAGNPVDSSTELEIINENF